MKTFWRRSRFSLIYIVDSINCIAIDRLIYQSDEPTSVIVIDDACVDGYTVIDKPPEDLDVSKSIIRRLAKFHAASYFLVSDHVSNIAWTSNRCAYDSRNLFRNSTASTSIITFTAIQQLLTCCLAKAWKHSPRPSKNGMVSGSSFPDSRPFRKTTWARCWRPTSQTETSSGLIFSITLTST